MATTLPITATLAFEPLGADCDLLSLNGSEGMSELSRWHVVVRSSDGDLDLEKAVGQGAELLVTDAAEGHVRKIFLVVAAISHESALRDGHHYEFDLVPVEWLLTQRSGYQIFQGKTAPEIVTQVLQDNGISGPKVVWRLTGTYSERDYCVQYDETDWAFCERLLADDGISYWFDVADDQPVIVFGDDAHSYDGIDVPTVVPFDDRLGMISNRHFFEFELSEQVVTQGVHVRDYDVRRPDVLIEGKVGLTGTAQPDYFEFPACVPTSRAAQARAQVRLEQLQRNQHTGLGLSDCSRIQPGRRMTLDGCVDTAINQDYLVARVHHHYAASTNVAGEDQGRPYTNSVDLMVLKQTARRPAIRDFVPKVEGIETAITTGPGSEEIHVDDLACVKIRFPWDRSGIMDDKSSMWIRTMQMNMGAAMLLPRVGWEVPVMYWDGNPDRPLVLGRVYNAQGVVPYGLPAGKATTSLQSATSPGGGSTNEIRTGDTGGSMEMFVHASKDQSVFVGGSRTVHVAANETHDVKLSYGVDVKASQTHSVGASQKLDVTTDHTTQVKGARQESVGALEAWKIGGNRVVDSASNYGELVGGLYGLQCNQANTDVKGGYAQKIGAKMGHTCGLGFSENVAGARGIHVGGSRSIIAGKAYGEKVTGIKRISAGASSVSAAAIKTIGKASGTIKAASANVEAGGPVVIGSPSITIEVTGTITCPGMTLGGGALKLSKGKTKVDGTIKREGGSDIEP
jgi:type VI secretion system secreted protein VgrG